MELDFAKAGGMVPAVIQDHADSRVLMVGFMNQAAFDKTVSSGLVTFFSRTRNKLWTKGETSGNVLLLKAMEVDCDRDTLLIQVEAKGPGVCHAGYRSCFFRRFDNGSWTVAEEQTYDPKATYGS